jgi:hypothetical protein
MWIDRARQNEQASGVDDVTPRCVGGTVVDHGDNPFTGNHDVSRDQLVADHDAPAAHDERVHGPGTPNSAVKAGHTMGSWPGTSR